MAKEVLKLGNKITYFKRNANEGGNAFVYDAIYKGESGFVVKILKDLNRGNHKCIQRFKMEMRETLVIQDKVKGIIRIIDNCGNKDKKYWYLMPKATPLRDKINEEKKRIFPIPKVDQKISEEKEKELKDKELKFLKYKCRAIIEIAEVISALHKKEIHHRDIKPQNIYFWEETFCLSDFGLIDFPEKPNLTPNSERLGPQGYMPDEMYKNTKNADYKKVDVYELAKTFWSILTENTTIFLGKYDENDSGIGIRNYFKFSHHIVELEEVLIRSTEYIPERRPTIDEFIEHVKFWFKCIENQRYRSARQWQYINSRLFPQTVPATACFTNIEDILNVLGRFCKLPDLNHVFLPSGGGLDFSSVSKAGELGCINVNTGGYSIILKPKCLYIENVSNDFMWSYARLEVKELEPIHSEKVDEFMGVKKERLTEIAPGQYDSWLLGNYGRNWDGNLLPENAKNVVRYLSGSFVFFNHASIYYKTSETYDARHNKLSADAFRERIGMMKDIYDVNHNKYKDIFNIVIPPSPLEVMDINEKQQSSDAEIKIFENFIKNEVMEIDFTEICSKYITAQKGRSIFYVKIKIGRGAHNILSSDGKYYLDDSCKMSKIKGCYSFSAPENALIFPSYNMAKKATREINNSIACICKENGIESFGSFDINIDFDHCLLRNTDIKPTHLFTLNEVLFALKTGNDSKINSLVITDNGYCRLIDRSAVPLLEEYPVSFESFQPYNNYVGRFTRLENRTTEYKHLLSSWYDYLRDDSSFCLDSFCNLDEQEILNGIKEFY